MTRALTHLIPRGALACALLIFTAAGVAGCQATRNQVRGTSNIVALDDAPGRHLGNQVTIAGEVDTVYGPGVFLVESDGGVVDEEILVVVPARAGLDAHPPAEDDEIRVRGLVRAADLATLRRELAGGELAALEAAIVDLGDDAEGADTLVIIADRIDLPDFATVSRPLPDAGLPPRRGWVNAIERKPIKVPAEPGELP